MTFKRIALCAALLSSGMLARADNLVQNGGFETGDFSGYTVTNAPSGSFLGIFTLANSGNYAAGFAGDPGSYDSLAQTLATIAGNLYQVQFYVSQQFGDPTDTDFQALWNGTVIYDSLGLGASDYTMESFTLTAVGNDTLSFRGFNGSGVDLLDDISVSTVTPEPSSFAMLGTGLLGIAGAARRRFAA